VTPRCSLPRNSTVRTYQSLAHHAGAPPYTPWRRSSVPLRQPSIGQSERVWTLGAMHTHGRVPAHYGEISQVHPSTTTRTKRPRREGSHSLLAALAPLVTPSKPAVWAHIAWAGPLPVRLPTPTVASPSRRLRQGRHTQQHPCAPRPARGRQARRHGRCRGPPLFGGARPLGRQRLGPRHAYAGVRQTAIGGHGVQGPLLASTRFAFAQGRPPPASHRAMLTDGQGQALDARGVELPATGGAPLLNGLKRAEHPTVRAVDPAPAP
jgi:hypothetical protein